MDEPTQQDQVQADHAIVPVDAVPEPEATVRPGNGGIALKVSSLFKKGNRVNPGGIAKKRGSTPTKWLAALSDCSRTELRKITRSKNASTSKVAAARLLLDASVGDKYADRPTFAKRRLDAISEICDRMDGKATQKIQAQVESVRHNVVDVMARTLTRDQLEAIKAARAAISSVPESTEPTDAGDVVEAESETPEQ